MQMPLAQQRLSIPVVAGVVSVTVIGFVVALSVTQGDAVWSRQENIAITNPNPDKSLAFETSRLRQENAALLAENQSLKAEIGRLKAMVKTRDPATAAVDDTSVDNHSDASLQSATNTPYSIALASSYISFFSTTEGSLQYAQVVFDSAYGYFLDNYLYVDLDRKEALKQALIAVIADDVRLQGLAANGDSEALALLQDHNRRLQQLSGVMNEEELAALTDFENQIAGNQPLQQFVNQLFILAPSLTTYGTEWIVDQLAEDYSAMVSEPINREALSRTVTAFEYLEDQLSAYLSGQELVAAQNFLRLQKGIARHNLTP